MSRSRKKNPFVPCINVRRGTEQFFKKKARRKIRRIGCDEDLPCNAYYKRKESVLTWACDGKYKLNEPRGYRK